MAGVDLSLYTFDYDLTFAALLMNGDGTIYHRYGTRDSKDASGRLSEASLLRLLRETGDDHAEYQRGPRPPAPRPRRTIEEIPPMARKVQKKKIDCFHCHMVNDAERDWAREQGRYERDVVLSMWPLPDKIGLQLGRDDPTLVEGVVPGSPAALAGANMGDRVVRLGTDRVRSQMDVQWVLENASAKKTTLAIELERPGNVRLERRIELKEGWKLATEEEFSWRASMWQLRPRPGFGGRLLAADELEALSLPAGTWALKIGYIVDWGEEAYSGQNVRRAGLQGGDVVLAVAGKRDFLSELHFQSWFRFHRKAGETVEIEALRGRKKLTVQLPVLE